MILESLVSPDAIDEELAMAAKCFETAATDRSYADASDWTGRAP